MSIKSLGLKYHCSIDDCKYECEIKNFPIKDGKAKVPTFYCPNKEHQESEGDVALLLEITVNE